MFIYNRYHRIYYSIIAAAKSSGRMKHQGVYYECHHILPKCIAPEYSDLIKHPDNGVLLTAKEHFIAHRLLCKFTVGEARVKCLSAYNAVCHKTYGRRDVIPTSLQYRKAREAAAEAASKPRGFMVPKWSQCRTMEEFKEYLDRLVSDGLSDPAIGKMHGISSNAVNTWRKKLCIGNRRQLLKDEEWLRKQYIIEQRTCADIASELKCTGTAVQQYLRKYGISLRRGNERWLSSKLYDEQWLRGQIHRSLDDIANEIGCSRPTVSTALSKFGISK